MAQRQFTTKRKAANAFDLRYGDRVDAEAPSWRLCEKVLAMRDLTERMSRGRWVSRVIATCSSGRGG